jgi:hypothetical protein
MLASLLAMLVLVPGAAPPVAVELNDQNWTHWRDDIRPKSAELSWQKVPWRANFWDAVLEAQRQDKPILLHPLACT